MDAKLRFMGVEEAFNIPLKETPSVEFVAAPGGTGAMLKALRSDPPEADVALALTESVVAAIEKGSRLRILDPYVASPLTWAICVRPRESTNLSAATWGISREGSGSHTMAFVLAKERDWGALVFHICDDFRTLRASLADGTIDAFLWEHFTASPYAASGDLDIVGGIPTPWGCFCAVVDPTRVNIAKARTALGAVVENSVEFQSDDSGVAVDKIVDMTGMTRENASSWHKDVRYGCRSSSPGDFEGDLLKAQQTILEAGVIFRVNAKDVKDYCV